MGQNTHTHTHLHIFTGKRGLLACNHPTEDTTLCSESPNRGRNVTWRYPTEDVNRGHALKSIFRIIFIILHPHKPRTVRSFLQVLGLLWNFLCVSLFDGWLPTQRILPFSIVHFLKKNKCILSLCVFAKCMWHKLFFFFFFCLSWVQCKEFKRGNQVSGLWPLC